MTDVEEQIICDDCDKAIEGEPFTYTAGCLCVNSCETCYKKWLAFQDKYCECSFPKFIIKDGYQRCRCCGLLDHYKEGNVAEWSDDEDQDLS